MSTKKVSVFGLGKLGATMVGCFASKGCEVIGVDIDAAMVEQVGKHKSPVPEPGLQELYDAHKGSISATQDVRAAVHGSDISFIIVPTPSMPDGEFFTTIASDVARAIGEALVDKSDYHLIVLTSTVLPGATNRDVRRALEEGSNKACGIDFGLCYSPEFIAIGNVIRGLLQPDFFLIGEYDQRSGDLLEDLYRQIGGTDVEVVRMNIENAELTKIAINTFVTTKISFANTLSRICSMMAGGDAHVVSYAVGLDKRIGQPYMKPGPAYGGPCFPRDNRAFAWFARSVGAEAPLAMATEAINRHQIDFLIQEVIANIVPDAVIGLLGLSYKPDTHVVDESQSIDMARRFIGRNHTVLAYDPWVCQYGLPEAMEGLTLCDTVDECIQNSDMIVIATPHDEFAALTPDDLCRNGQSLPVVDVWGMLRARGFASLPNYSVPGVNRR
tara:strand:- start:25 stop:1350 length:1326 start_codon:yes stop_codon:yes gene_type:complete